MELFYVQNEFKTPRRAKNSYFLFLVYIKYFSGFILSRLRFFELNQIKRLG
jgi:hypothetical protein